MGYAGENSATRSPMLGRDGLSDTVCVKCWEPQGGMFRAAVLHLPVPGTEAGFLQESNGGQTTHSHPHKGMWENTGAMEGPVRQADQQGFSPDYRSFISGEQRNGSAVKAGVGTMNRTGVGCFGQIIMT